MQGAKLTTSVDYLDTWALPRNRISGREAVNVLRDAFCPNIIDCPMVYEPIEDGRLPVRGDKLSPELRAQLGTLPDHEDVVLVPPTVLSDVHRVLTLGELLEFITERHTSDVFRLEVLPYYNAASDEDDYRRYLRGEAAPAATVKAPWLDRIRLDTAAGRIWRRVHAVTEPLTDYLKYEAEWGYRYSAAAGEQIRIAPLTSALTKVGDFFVIEGERVVRSRYDASGRFQHAELLQSDAAAPYVAIAALLWEQAEDFTTWWAARPQYHRDQAA